MKKYLFKQNLLTIFIAGLCSTSISFASVVSNQIPYQTYLDFARNRGEFKSNSIGENILDKQGKTIASLNTPMADFSSVDIYLRVATLINPQYVVSVAHNVGYRSVTFGDKNNSYQLVNTNTCNRNQKMTLCRDDVHIPRLDKLVTDVAPTAIFDSDEEYKNLLIGDRYSAFYRTGTGIQAIYDPITKKRTGITGAYSIAIGGIIPKSELSINHNVITQNLNGEHLLTFKIKNKDFIPSQNNPLPTIAQPGDSGSPIFVYDNQEKRWKIITVLHAISGNLNGTANTYSTFIPIWLVNKIINLDNINITTNRNQDYIINKENTTDNSTYSFKSSSNIENNKVNITFTGAANQHKIKYPDYAHDKNYINYDLDNGKNLILTGGGNINLANNVDQGAGSLTFNGNYTISSNNNSTWVGAGLNIADKKMVIWKINGLDDKTISYTTINRKGKKSTHHYNKNNGLYKIGKGTLIINATGTNTGKIRVGDGLVILNQQPDTNHKTQVASQLWIVSGRPTVQLENSNQINPDNIYWGFRGGLLDTNGNNLNFTTLNAADIGANLGNNNLNKISNITLTPNYSLYAITNKDKTITIPALIYHGNLTGNINFNLNLSKNNTYVFDGNIGNLNQPISQFNQNNGNLIFQGHPVIHSYITGRLFNKLKNIVPSIKNSPTSATQNDWENRIFHIKNLVINNGNLSLGRNATLLIDQDLILNNSTFNLNHTKVYTDPQDGNGIFNSKGGVTANITNINMTTLDQKDMPIFNGNIITRNSKIDISNGDINNKFTLISGGEININNKSNVNFGTANINSNLSIKDSTITFNSGSTVTGKIDLSNTTINFNSTNFNGYFNQINNKNISTPNSLFPILIQLDNEIISSNQPQDNSDIILNNSDVNLTNNSNINNLILNGNSKLSFTNDPQHKGYTLTVRNLQAEKQIFQFNIYNENNADKIKVTEKAIGKDNRINLQVENNSLFRHVFQNRPQLIELPSRRNSKELFRINSINDGITNYIPEIVQINNNNNTSLELAGFLVKYNPIFSQNINQLLNSPSYILLNTNENSTSLLNNISIPENNIWVRTNLSHENVNNLTIFNDNLILGLNKNINNSNIGIILKYDKSVAKINDLENNIKLAEITFLYQYKFLKDFFTNIETKYDKIYQNISIPALDIKNTKPKINYFITNAILGFNYPILNKLLTLQPSIQLSSGYLSGYEINNQNFTAKIDNSIPLIGKLGIQLTHKNKENNFSISVYYEKDYNYSGKVHLKDFNFNQDYAPFKDKRLLLDLTLSQKLSSHSKFYFQTFHNLNGKLTENSILAGINYNFK